MSSSPTPSKAAPLTVSKAAPPTPMTIASASSTGDQDTRLMAMEAKLQETINSQDARFREMLNQMMIFFQKAPSLQGHPADWTFPKEPQQGPMQMDTEEDVFDQAAREMGCTREHVIELNGLHMQELAEAQMMGSAGPSERI